jgi:sulfate transport system ATP-binding protein
MSKGRIEQVGTPDEVYDNPATSFVHAFIGESSELAVTIVNGAVLYADRPTGLRANGSGPATLFFRPHAVELADSAAHSLVGRVVGSRRIAGVRRLELDITASRRVEIDVPANHPAGTGSPVAFRPTAFRLFPETGFVETVRPKLVVNG